VEKDTRNVGNWIEILSKLDGICCSCNGRSRSSAFLDRVECVLGYLRDQGMMSCRSNGPAVLASSKGGGSGIRASLAESKSGPCRPSVRGSSVRPFLFARLLIVEVNVPIKIPGSATNSRVELVLVCLLSVLKTKKSNTKKKDC